MVIIGHGPLKKGSKEAVEEREDKLAFLLERTIQVVRREREGGAKGRERSMGNSWGQRQCLYDWDTHTAFTICAESNHTHIYFPIAVVTYCSHTPYTEKE